MKTVALEAQNRAMRGASCRGSAAMVRRVSATVLNSMSKTTLRLPKAIRAMPLGRVKTAWKLSSIRWRTRRACGDRPHTGAGPGAPSRETAR